jgi:hypothetical protein
MIRILLIEVKFPDFTIKTLQSLLNAMRSAECDCFVMPDQVEVTLVKSSASLGLFTSGRVEEDLENPANPQVKLL